MQELKVIEVKGTRVLTTPQLAECYGCDRKTISYNFQYNRKRYAESKHYIELRDEELRQFKNRLEIQDSLKHASVLYLWTEKGALLHAKSLNTDKAWEVYDYLVDFYFRAQEKPVKVQAVSTSKAAEAKELKTERKSHPFDIAPVFREVVTLLPVESLDEMEKGLRNGDSRALKLAVVAILTEKIKRQLV